MRFYSVHAQHEFTGTLLEVNLNRDSIEVQDKLKFTFFYFSHQEGGYSVSMKAPDKIKHFRVEFTDGKFKIGPRNFSTVEELIEHYKRAPIFTDKAGNKMFLVKPFEEGS